MTEGGPGRGRLFVFEGIDGCGKSTLCHSLHQYFISSGRQAVLRKEPTNGRWGQQLYRIIEEGRAGLSPEKELELFIKDRREHVAEGIGPDLLAGRLVILDRYYLSTAAYQGALGLDPEEILKTNETFAPRPHLAFILDVDVETSLDRITSGRDGKRTSFEKQSYLERVKRVFDSLDRPFIRHVDGNLSTADVLGQVLTILRRGYPDLFTKQNG